jgi:cellulose synthase operon protein C
MIRMSQPARLALLLAIVAVQAQTQASPALTAQRAFFLESDLEAAGTHAAAALRGNAADPRALFVQMEAAALHADTPAMLDAALRLCEVAPGDPRAEIAAARVRSQAGNTRLFRAVLPRVQELVKARTPEAQTLRLALVAAAADGAPGLRLYTLVRAAGVVTEWRMLGPFGHHSYADFDRVFAPQHDSLAAADYDARPVERFNFADGSVLLPDHFGRSGVFYAAADVRLPRGGDWRLEVESAGTLEVYVDGRRVLTHDRRFRAGPQMATRDLHLAAGTRRVLVKFVPTAAPWRLAVLPGSGPQPPRAARGFVPEGDYLGAARRYWRGDFDGAIGALTTPGTTASAATLLLLADAWASHAAQSAEEAAALHAALREAPSALLLEFRLAQLANAGERDNEAIERLRRVLRVRPDFMPAHALMAQIATGLRWDAAALEARQALVKLHPSCDSLRAAARFFARSARFDRAVEAEQSLQGCAPGSLAYAEALAESGHHAESAAAAAEALAEDPLHRSALALLVRQLELAGEHEEARQQARRLRDLSPNSPVYRELVRRLSASSAMPPAQLEDEDAFYAPYRRDPWEVMRAGSGRGSGGSAVLLLHDRVARVAEDGSVSLYVHTLTRVLSRSGLARQREVSLPRGAELLELRTLKADGSFSEPEFTPHKDTVSMTGLAPGDVIQQEYVMHYRSQRAAAEPDALRFFFGSFAMPTALSRFVTLTPARGEGGDAFEALAWGAPPPPRVSRQGGMRVRVWELENLPQTAREPNSPPEGALPGVRLVPARDWPEVRDRYRDLALRSTRIGHQVERAAATLPQEGEAALVRHLFRAVADRIRPTPQNFAGGQVRTAEESLAAGQGSRSMVLLAMARAAGLRADLVLARDLAAFELAGRPAAPSVRAYTRPLVRVHAAGRSWLLDAETEGLEFGRIPPDVARADALLVPLEHVPAAPLLIALAQPADGERNLARGELTLDAAGDLAADFTLVMGSWNGAEMRRSLREVPSSRRLDYWQTLARRSFPGAAEVTGDVLNEDEHEQPLEVRLRFRVPRYLRPGAERLQLDQLAPALALRRQYAQSSSRRLPLYLNGPLFEESLFRLHLPAGVRLDEREGSGEAASEFGSYVFSFREVQPGVVELRRRYHVPVQRVEAARYPAFREFARRIDEIESRRLPLSRR